MQLHRRKMVKFRIRRLGSKVQYIPALGIFFAVKKNGDLRVIFDARVLNCSFLKPPATCLPTAGALGSLKVRSSNAYLGTLDIKNTFHGMGVPEDLADDFALPSCLACCCNIFVFDGVRVGRRDILEPYLAVLPMGWSWALHICQSVVEAAAPSIVGEKRLIQHRRPGVVVEAPAREVGQMPGLSGDLDDLPRDPASQRLPSPSTWTTVERGVFATCRRCLGRGDYTAAPLLWAQSSAIWSSRAVASASKGSGYGGFGVPWTQFLIDVTPRELCWQSLLVAVLGALWWRASPWPFSTLSTPTCGNTQMKYFA
jgi:hypothetical protein